MRRFAAWRYRAALARAEKERRYYREAWTGLDMDLAQRLYRRHFYRAQFWRRFVRDA